LGDITDDKLLTERFGHIDLRAALAYVKDK
jgi:hypothetical protein